MSLIQTVSNRGLQTASGVMIYSAILREVALAVVIIHRSFGTRLRERRDSRISLVSRKFSAK
jgi:hypothetical protein